jgi:hypothetical protein
MKPLTYFSVAAQQVATHPVEVDKLEVTLNAAATAGLYLQIHDTNQTPAEGAVPLRSWLAAECAYKEFKRAALTLNVGLYICLSSTAATKTLAVGGSDLMDILEVELLNPEEPTGTTYVGDTSTGVTSRQIWSEAAGATRKRLYSLEVDGTGLSAAAYIMLFAKDSPANGDKPVFTWPLADNQVRTGANALRFGRQGIDVSAADTDGTYHYGCTVAISSTPGTLTTIVAQTATIKGEYK